MMTCTRGRAFGKRGASGGYCMGIREAGLGTAVKMDDGAMVQYYAAMRFLDWVGVRIGNGTADQNENDDSNAAIKPTEDQIVELEKFRSMPNVDYQLTKVGIMTVPKTIFPGSYEIQGNMK